SRLAHHHSELNSASHGATRHAWRTTKKAALVESSLPEREIDSQKVIKFPNKNNKLGNCVQLVLLVGFRL
ncbi:hypothetical protein, partial [Pseudomonas helleri]|uniref:hypothetical protein n=2 Tax=Pseudomonas helleri TaxID=1608996 RepID=UPI001E4C0B2B